MISLISGRLVTKELDRVEVLTSGGVGYELSIPLGTYEALPRVGENVSLHTSLVVREDDWLLYGFATPHERAVFRSPPAPPAEEQQHDDDRGDSSRYPTEPRASPPSKPSTLSHASMTSRRRMPNKPVATAPSPPHPPPTPSRRADFASPDPPPSARDCSASREP